jgi:hypothetical protein
MQTKLPSNGPRGRDQIPSLRDANSLYPSFFDPGFPVHERLSFLSIGNII